MLILIAGITGYLGRELAKYGLAKQHQIRGFGRSPSKLPPHLLDQLESFVQCDDYQDRAVLDKALSGVDAVICAYYPIASAVIESQLSLFRAVERAGVKIYHAHSWNFDWSKLKFGDFELYDSYISFRRQVELTSSIKPVFVFTGLFAELSVSEHFGIGNIVDSPDGKVLTYWGDGDTRWSFTYMPDAARFSMDLITTNQAVLNGEGGLFSVQSAAASARDLAAAYEKKTGDKVQLKSLGSVEDAEAKLTHVRTTSGMAAFFTIAYLYGQVATIRGWWNLDNPKTVGSPDAVERLFDSQIDRSAEFGLG
ncbi:hypothetical protein BKA67DRAFT_135470 [Truncatella angustata]|uniref:NmrA-like domain-containing protein n=1 Tax=Truncatella angustata TaxID=152316 RepID=A0A9P8RKD8_9PEZI|nr:uncharacterized protein BKA67DRAFT_135470 [Truncatella angustata]KAH6643464.1 hypothetical protein BKA67DRAFT_135470 [Truncatella angustata]KAH8202315.1 hypothetical protein TruAng_003487 [Truncatella angustata]